MQMVACHIPDPSFDGLHTVLTLFRRAPFPFETLTSQLHAETPVRISSFAPLHSSPQFGSPAFGALSRDSDRVGRLMLSGKLNSDLRSRYAGPAADSHHRTSGFYKAQWQPLVRHQRSHSLCHSHTVSMVQKNERWCAGITKTAYRIQTKQKQKKTSLLLHY